ncbi:MAG: tRNA (adenosine(37)-N6)-threonylcarbamoyltransferase complex dimerization subunit type 1 TsaB, partial [Pseudomonadota bacterium]
VYWAEARARADGGVDLLREGLARPEAVDPAAERFVGAGHGWSAYPELLARFAARAVRVQPELLPRAAWVARLGALDLAAGRGLDPADAAPVYLRDDVATRSARTPRP